MMTLSPLVPSSSVLPERPQVPALPDHPPDPPWPPESPDPPWRPLQYPALHRPPRRLRLPEGGRSVTCVFPV